MSPSASWRSRASCTSLDDQAKQGNWIANLPPLLVKNMSYDGHVIAVPVNIHGANYQFYSIKVFHDLKMQPPKTWDEFLVDGTEDQGRRHTSRSRSVPMRSSSIGCSRRSSPAPAARICTARCSSTMTRRPPAVDGCSTSSVMGQLRQYVDAGSPNRKWNDSLALVETDKAALMICRRLGSRAILQAPTRSFGKDYRLPDGAR